MPTCDEKYGHSIGPQLWQPYNIKDIGSSTGGGSGPSVTNNVQYVINLPNFDAALLEAIKTLPGDQVTTPLLYLATLGFLTYVLWSRTRFDCFSLWDVLFIQDSGHINLPTDVDIFQLHISSNLLFFLFIAKLPPWRMWSHNPFISSIIKSRRYR
jgi:hypothetical protein